MKALASAPAKDGKNINNNNNNLIVPVYIQGLGVLLNITTNFFNIKIRVPNVIYESLNLIMYFAFFTGKKKLH